MVLFRIDIVVEPRRAARGAKQVETALAKTETRAVSLGRALRNTFAGVGAALIVREITQLSDTYTALQNRLRLVTADQTALADVTQQLFEIANNARVPFEATAELYARVALSAKELGRSQQELLNFTESVNQAVKISGATGQEAHAGLIQFAQGLASGTLRGDELRSVLEQLPKIADVISGELNITRGQLRKMGEQGKITADIVLDAFKNARQELAEEFATTIPTISEAFVVLKNQVTQTIGEFNESSGFAQAIAEGLISLANNFGVLLNAIGLVATALLITLTVKAIGPTITGLVNLKIASIAAGGAFTLAAGALALASVKMTEFLKHANEIKKVLNDIEADSQAVPRAGQLITLFQREANTIRRAIVEQQKRGVEASKQQLEQLETLRVKIQSLKGAVKEGAAGEETAADTAKAAAEEKEALAEATARQKKLLDSILAPQAKFNTLQQDLNALLKTGKINEDQFRAALEKRKPTELKKAEENPFKEQIDSLKDLNGQLDIKLRLQGAARTSALLEHDLLQEGVKLTEQQKTALFDAVQANTKLTEQFTKQNELRAKAKSIADERRKEKERTIELLEPNNQLIEQEKLLKEIYNERPDLLENIEQAYRRMRITALESARDAGSGFERAFLKLEEEANDHASAAEAAVQSFANNATDALTSFVESGKFSFEEFAEALLKDITRIIVRLLVVKALSSLGANAGAATFAADQASAQGNKQHGGTVQPGQTLNVGENGPERVTFGRTATITPNIKDQPQAAAPNVNVRINNQLDSKDVVRAGLEGGANDEEIFNAFIRNPGRAARLLQNQ